MISVRIDDEAAMARELRAAALELCPSCNRSAAKYYSMLVPGRDDRIIFCDRCADPATISTLIMGLTPG